MINIFDTLTIVFSCWRLSRECWHRQLEDELRLGIVFSLIAYFVKIGVLFVLVCFHNALSLASLSMHRLIVFDNHRGSIRELRASCFALYSEILV